MAGCLGAGRLQDLRERSAMIHDRCGAMPIEYVDKVKFGLRFQAGEQARIIDNLPVGFVARQRDHYTAKKRWHVRGA
jgi:hypothetical protein